MLKFELALRSHSPKIEMFQQIAKDRGVNKMPCENVIDYNGKLSCEIKDEIQKDQPTIEMTEIENDHRYVHWDPEADKTVILYGKIGSRKFSEMHNALKSKASHGLIKYVVRHYLVDTNKKTPQLRLSGYGVELQIKSSEYKAQDDRKVNVDGQELGNAEPDSTGKCINNKYYPFQVKLLYWGSFLNYVD